MGGAPLLAAALLLTACVRSAPPDPASGERFIDISELDPSIAVDIRYATADNFTRTVLYPVNRCALRRRAAQALVQVQKELRSGGLGLKVWDCYRPLSIQNKLWELVPDPRYVADPKRGSRHNRGAAVDATLVDRSGRELEMPTGYDDFSERAHRDYAAAAPAARKNSEQLARVMEKHGFTGLRTEWWHFDFAGWREYDVEDRPLEAL
ncbi:MAG: M15 family metallopeptidase [Elusimicrobiota bacterium]